MRHNQCRHYKKYLKNEWCRWMILRQLFINFGKEVLEFYMKNIFKFLIFLLCFFAALWIANIVLKNKGINITEMNKEKKIKIKEYREARNEII